MHDSHIQLNLRLDLNQHACIFIAMNQRTFIAPLLPVHEVRSTEVDFVSQLNSARKLCS